MRMAAQNVLAGDERVLVEIIEEVKSKIQEQTAIISYLLR